MENIWTYPAECIEVVDGDTYDLRVDLGFKTTKTIRIRMRGVDTAEVYGVPKESEEYQAGSEQSAFVREWFEEADSLYVETHKDEKGKYGRYLADVENESGESLRETIVSRFPSTHREL